MKQRKQTKMPHFDSINNITHDWTKQANQETETGLKKLIQLYVDHRRHTLVSKTKYMTFLSTYRTSSRWIIYARL